MKKDWRKISWSATRILLVKLLQSFALRLSGPWGWLGWVATQLIPSFIDKKIKPIFQTWTRKRNKKRRVKEGRAQAQDVRDASTDDIDNIYDTMSK